MSYKKCFFLSWSLIFINLKLNAECQKPLQLPSIKKEDVYANVPFKPGEKASYEVFYYGIKVGYGHLEVRDPVQHNTQWHRHFTVNASTGDWYKAFFVAKDSAMAYSHPENFAISKFYISQNEGKIFTRRFIQEKWLSFYHDSCEVKEIVKKGKKPIKKEIVELSPGANDSLGVTYRMRTLEYKIGELKELKVYSSGKNWWLKAMPLAFETISVSAGTFETVKMKLETYVGKDLEQKGDVYAWFATKHPLRPLVRVQGEVKVGSVLLELTSLTNTKETPSSEILKDKEKKASAATIPNLVIPQ